MSYKLARATWWGCLKTSPTAPVTAEGRPVSSGAEGLKLLLRTSHGTLQKCPSKCYSGQSQSRNHPMESHLTIKEEQSFEACYHRDESLTALSHVKWVMDRRTHMVHRVCNSRTEKRRYWGWDAVVLGSEWAPSKHGLGWQKGSGDGEKWLYNIVNGSNTTGLCI